MIGKLLSAAIGLLTVSGALRAQGVFWTEVGGGTIDSSSFNGTAEKTLLSSLSTPYGIAFDANSGKIYWTEVANGYIYRSNRDGTSPQAVLAELSLPRGIAIDEANLTMYWTENGSKKIRSALLAGGGISDIITSGLSAPTGIAVDAKNGEIYWTDNGGNSKYIGKCGLTGTSPTHIYSTTNFVSGIAVDTAHSKIYWTEYGPHKRIMSAALDGSDTASVLTLSSSDPRGIQLMSSAGIIFWTNYLTNTVESANTDGSDTAFLASSGLNNPLSIVTTSDGILQSAFAGYPGTALYFDGTSNFVNAGSSSSFNFTGPFTVEGWFKASSILYQWQALITKGDNSWRVARSNSTNYLAFSTNGLSNIDMTGVTNINDGNWHFFAAVYNGSSKTLYVDGHIDATAPVTGTLSTSTFPVYFGENAGHTGRYFNGTMDEIRIWKIARSEQQIKNDMFATIGGVQAGLLGYWQFNDGSGSAAADLVSGNSGSINGTPNWVTSDAPVGQYGVYDAGTGTSSAGPANATINLTITSSPDSVDFVGAYAYGSPYGSITDESFPSGVTRRSSLIWGLYGYGSNTVTYSMNYVGVNGVSDESTLELIGRSEADAGWSNLTGFYYHNTSLHDFSSAPTSLGSVAPSKQFALASGNDNPLAVELSSFSATTDVHSVTLSWQTKSEIGIAGFNVLRKNSADSIFALVESYVHDDSLKGLGNSQTGQRYHFRDSQVISGMSYNYKLQSVSTDGTATDFPPLTVEVSVPASYTLYQNYPNPFNPSTTIGYDIPELSNVNLAIYDILGRRLVSLVNENKSPGHYEATLDGSKLSSGVYFYKLNAGSFSQVKKMLLMK